MTLMTELEKEMYRNFIDSLLKQEFNPSEPIPIPVETAIYLVTKRLEELRQAPSHGETRSEFEYRAKQQLLMRALLRALGAAEETWAKETWAN